MKTRNARVHTKFYDCFFRPRLVCASMLLRYFRFCRRRRGCGAVAIALASDLSHRSMAQIFVETTCRSNLITSTPFDFGPNLFVFPIFPAVYRMCLVVRCRCGKLRFHVCRVFIAMKWAIKSITLDLERGKIVINWEWSQMAFGTWRTRCFSPSVD